MHSAKYNRKDVHLNLIETRIYSSDAELNFFCTLFSVSYALLTWHRPNEWDQFSCFFSGPTSQSLPDAFFLFYFTLNFSWVRHVLMRNLLSSPLLFVLTLCWVEWFLLVCFAGCPSGLRVSLYASCAVWDSLTDSWGYISFIGLRWGAQRFVNLSSSTHLLTLEQSKFYLRFFKKIKIKKVGEVFQTWECSHEHCN